VTSGPISRQYQALVAEGRLSFDAEQARVVDQLDALRQVLDERRRPGKSSPLGWLLGRRDASPAPKGLYIWGSVGRGKTMLMDLFFDALAEPRKRRAHFHAFMADVHARIHVWREAERLGKTKGSDPIAPVAADLAASATVLCFDEFAVNDIADAMILGRLFRALFGHGVTVIATSNVEPQNLYADGLNRALFLPFIDLLVERMAVIRLDARTDFRLEKLAGGTVYHVPADAAAAAALEKSFEALSGGMPARASSVEVAGRKVAIPRAAGGVAFFRFGELCEAPLGASDYIALAQRFHTIVLAGIPRMGLEQRNAAKRFITLIDVLYENHVKLVASAEAPATELYMAGQGREAFEFDRTVSRLIEMRSGEYLAMPHGHHGPRDRGDTGSLVET